MKAAIRHERFHARSCMCRAMMRHELLFFSGRSNAQSNHGITEPGACPKNPVLTLIPTNRNLQSPHNDLANPLESVDQATALLIDGLRVRPYKTLDSRLEGVVMSFINIDGTSEKERAACSSGSNVANMCRLRNFAPH